MGQRRRSSMGAAARTLPQRRRRCSQGKNGMGERMGTGQAFPPARRVERPRVAVINTHPIQHFAPLWAEIARQGEVALKVLFCSDWGVKEYRDPGFDRTFRWDVELLSGYDYEILPIKKR